MQCHASQNPPPTDASGLECHEYFRLARSRVGTMEDETDLLAGVSPNVLLAVKILGVGCARCRALEHAVRAVAQARGIAANIMRVENLIEIMRYHLLASPGLVVNEQLVCAGRVPSRDEIVEFLQNGLAK